jgi:hypothetical protein
MRKLSVIAAALGMLLLSTTAQAVVRESEVTITQDGKPVAGATIALQAEPAKPQPAGTPARAATPPKPKTNTNNEGKVVVVYDDEKARDDDSFTLILRTRDGRIIGRLPGVTLAMLRSGKVDVPRQASTPARTAARTPPPPPVTQPVPSTLVTDSPIKYGGGAGIGVLRHEGTLEHRDAKGSGLSGTVFLEARQAPGRGPILGVRTGVLLGGGDADHPEVDLKIRQIFFLEGMFGIPIPFAYRDIPLEFLVALGGVWANSHISTPFGSDSFRSNGVTVALFLNAWLNQNAAVGLVARWIDMDGNAHLAPNLVRNIEQDSFSVMGYYTQYFASDARLKRDVVEIGKRSDGLSIYRYRYLWSETEFVGVIAQEAATVAPEAVHRGADGWLRVDYSKLGTKLMTWDEWCGPSLLELASTAR